MSKALEYKGEIDEEDQEQTVNYSMGPEIKEQTGTEIHINSSEDLKQFMIYCEKERVEKLKSMSEQLLNDQASKLDRVDMSLDDELVYIKQIFGQIPQYIAKIKQIQDRKESIAKTLNAMKKSQQTSPKRT